MTSRSRKNNNRQKHGRNKKSRKFGGATPEENYANTIRLSENFVRLERQPGTRTVITDDEPANEQIRTIRTLVMEIDPGYMKDHDDVIEDDENGGHPVTYQIEPNRQYTTLENMLLMVKIYPDIKLIEDLVKMPGQVFRMKTIIRAIKGFTYFDKRIDGVTEDIKKRIYKIMKKIVLRANLNNDDKYTIFKEAIRYYNEDVILILYNNGFLNNIPNLRELGYTNTGQPSFRGETPEQIRNRNSNEGRIIDLLKALHRTADLMYILESRGGLDAETYQGVFNFLTPR